MLKTHGTQLLIYYIFYVALVIVSVCHLWHQFWSCSCLGGEERTVEFLEREGGSTSDTPLLEHASEKGVIKHPFPMNYILKPWRLGEWFYLVIKFGIVQYVCRPCIHYDFLTFYVYLSEKVNWDGCLLLCADDNKDYYCYFSCDSWSFWGVLWRRIQMDLWVRDISKVRAYFIYSFVSLTRLTVKKRKRKRFK